MGSRPINYPFTTRPSFLDPRMLASDLPVLTGGPLSELRSIEKNALIAEIGCFYKLNERMEQTVLKVIFERVECPMAKGYLCKFLFDNNHRRWREFISVLHGYTYLAAPLLKAILRCNSVSDVMAYWHGLLIWSIKMVLLS